MITIVSGLPRCGTSLMMRMLDMGGIPALTDNERAADVDNPRGYYEFEAVKETKSDPSWIDQADGKVVKMVSQLLYDLPADRRYRVVFMERDMVEMMASQNKMLERLGQELSGDDAKMIQYLEKHLEQFDGWVAKQDHIDLLRVSYNQLLAAPAPQIARVREFLGGDLDESAMRSAIDVNLYRQRKKAIA